MSSAPIKPLAPLSENPKVHPGPGSSNSTAPGHNSRRASHSSSGRPDPLSSIAHASVRPPVATRPQPSPLTDEVVVSAGFSHRSRRHPDRLAHRPARRVDRRRKGKATRSLRSRRRARQGPPQGPRHRASLLSPSGSVGNEMETARAHALFLRVENVHPVVTPAWKGYHGNKRAAG